MSTIMIICGSIILVTIGIGVILAIKEKLKDNWMTYGCIILAAVIIIGVISEIPGKTREDIAIVGVVAIVFLILVFKMAKTLRLSFARWQMQRRNIRRRNIRAMGAQEQNQLRKVSLYKSQAINKRKAALLIAVPLFLIGIVLPIVMDGSTRLMSTQRPTSTSATGVTMYVSVNDGANVRACPETTCDEIGGLSPGAEIQALEWVEGEEVNGSSEWVQFEHNDTVAYVHGGLVSTKRPNQ